MAVAGHELDVRKKLGLWSDKGNTNALYEQDAILSSMCEPLWFPLVSQQRLRPDLKFG
jgi:hypothetical protein